VYQLSLNLVAAQVGADAGGYYWTFWDYSFFPFPIDPLRLGPAIMPSNQRLIPIEIYIYTHLYPSIAPRVMWSVMWLTLGIMYLILPLLSLKENPPVEEVPPDDTDPEDSMME
jgi:hypothetical protein